MIVGWIFSIFLKSPELFVHLRFKDFYLSQSNFCPLQQQLSIYHHPNFQQVLDYLLSIQIATILCYFSLVPVLKVEQHIKLYHFAL